MPKKNRKNPPKADKRPDVCDWYYSDLVKDHFFNPRNVLLKDPKSGEYDAEGVIGAPVCGDVMKMWIKLAPREVEGGDSMKRKIKKLKWRTFGCASAIASTSVFSETVIGMTIAEALKITPQDIVKKLGGLPALKIHCSVLADQAFKKTIENYNKKYGKQDKKNN